MFKAIYLTRENKQFSAELKTLDEAQLPAEGDVLARIEYSSINYKDGLAITDKAPVIRKWPMVAGLDCAGVVVSSNNPEFKPGDRFAVTGCGLGELYWGGLAQKARLNSEWLVRLPAPLDTKRAMGIGTAGYTAMLCVMALEKHGLKPGDGEILVTGATGGVGSVAIALLRKLGYRVIASTGKLAESDYLKSLGAAEVIDRAIFSEPGGRPLQKERFVGVVDSVGSHTLANACAQTKANGAVAACGLAQGMDFPATVAPFILRGVTLYGINSGTTARPLREEAWRRLARDLDMAKLDAMMREISLAESLTAAQEIVAGRVRGRLVVNVNAG
ncbi:MAG: MDR family oxidoreductase [Candidatus Korobacteraceae bacterium]|jgi:acrylyl-CoA reductase (NADPH)